MELLGSACDSINHVDITRRLRFARRGQLIELDVEVLVERGEVDSEVDGKHGDQVECGVLIVQRDHEIFNDSRVCVRVLNSIR